ncbi:MAG: ABC transporter permease [Phycisphaeraceae bacterium]|nr:ABC transporter permease [Phycisphaeraceae bacterium]
MPRFILWRLLQLPLIVAVVFLVTFTLVWWLPGNPLLRPDNRPSPEIERALLAQYHLDNPVTFMGEYLRDALHGDFGPSLQFRDQRVSDILRAGLPVSAAIGAAALALAVVLGVAAGMLGAVRPGTFADWMSQSVVLIGVSLPAFITGSVLLVIFGGLLKWFPVSGWKWNDPGYLVLPALTIALGPAAYIARLVRLGLADILNDDFIRTARAKGLPPRKVLFKHALKVAFLPVLSFLGPAAAVTMTGSFVVERVFSLPGIGTHFVTAVLNKDQFLILGIVTIFSTMLIGFNLIVDVLYAAVDPRIELT